MIEQAGESLYNRKHTITISGGDKMPGLCHRIIDLSNQLCTKSDDKATFVQS